MNASQILNAFQYRNKKAFPKANIQNRNNTFDKFYENSVKKSREAGCIEKTRNDILHKNPSKASKIQREMNIYISNLKTRSCQFNFIDLDDLLNADN